MRVGRIVEDRRAVPLQIERAHFLGLTGGELKFIDVQGPAQHQLNAPKAVVIVHRRVILRRPADKDGGVAITFGDHPASIRRTRLLRFVCQRTP